MNNLSEKERAYRRGALQALEFIMADVCLLPPECILLRLAQWKDALKKARTDREARYLGHFMDEVNFDVTGQMNRTNFVG